MRHRHIIAAVATAIALSLGHAPNVHAQTATTTVTPAQQRVDAALRVYTMLQAQYAIGGAMVEEVCAWGARWYQARRDTGLSGLALAGAAQEWVDKARAFERVVTTHMTAGTAAGSDVAKATYFRLDAEIELARVKQHP